MSSAQRPTKKPKKTDILLQENTATEATSSVVSVPSALGAEKSVLSLILKDPDIYMGKALEKGLNEHFFYFSGHKTLWNLLSLRFSKAQPLDMTSLTQFMSDNGTLDSIGGIPGLAELYSFEIIGAYFEPHLDILKEKFILRSIIQKCTESISKAYEPQEEIAALLDSVEQEILTIREQTQTEKKETFKSILRQAADRIEEFLANNGRIQGISSGFPVLDEKINGLKGGDMFVIAARPAMGKTSLLLNILEHIAVEQQKPVMMFSCEMPSVQLAERLFLARAGLNRSDLKGKKGTMNKENLQRFNRAMEDLMHAPIVLDDTASISITELRAKARRVKREGGLSAIGIDYLQLMRSHSKQAQGNREREIAEISAGLKALAKELDVPIIVLAQLNRNAEARTGAQLGVPRMSDLRESGAIEQDADMIGLLYRLDYYAEHKERKAGDPPPVMEGKAFLDLAKNRNGSIGKVPLTFIPELTRFIPRLLSESEQKEIED